MGALKNALPDLKVCRVQKLWMLYAIGRIACILQKNTRIIMLLDTVYVLYHDDPLPNHASMIRDRVIKITEGTV